MVPNAAACFCLAKEPPCRCPVSVGLAATTTRTPAAAVDIALVSECIAVEVDGPHHFTANTFQPLGEMASR